MAGGVATVARLAVSVTGDVDDLKTAMADAQSVVGAAAKDMAVNVSAVSDSTDKVTAAGQRMVAQLQEEVRTFGMSREEILIYKASLTGAGDEVARLVGQLQSLKAAQAAAPQLSADTQATQRIRDMVAASVAQTAAMNESAGAAQNLTTAQAGAARVAASWADSQRLQAQNMAGVTASMRAATAGTAELSAQTQAIMNRYDPLGTKLRALQSDLAILRKEIGNSVDPAAIKAFQGLEEEITKTQALMAKAGVEGFGAMEEGAKKGAFATAGATRELMVLGHEAISGNFSKIPGSLMILVDRMGMTSAMLNPMTLGMLGLSVATLAVVGAIIEGHNQMVAMDNALLVTSNYAGMSRQSMDQLAESMTRTHEVTIGTANAIVLALVSSGKIGGESINQIAHFISDFAKSTGQSVDEIAPKMISLFEDPIRGAQELNSSMHFLTTTQLEHIAALERTGQTQAAQAELAKAAADQMPKQAQNIGFVTAALLEQRDAWTKVGQAIMNWGKAKSDAEKAQSLRDDISDLMSRGVPRSSPQIEAIQAQLDALDPAIKKQKELTQAQKDAAAANELQAKSWDAVKASSTAYHIQELRDRLKLIEAHKSEAGPDFAAQEAAKRDAIRKTNDEIDAAQRSIGAEGRQLTQQEMTDGEQYNLLVLHGQASRLQNQLNFGAITKEQFDEGMTQNALYQNAEKQDYERRMANVAGLTAAERQGHLNKLKYLQEEAAQISDNGKAAVAIDSKKVMDDYMAALGKAGQAEIDSLSKQIEKEKQHGEEIGKTKDQVDALRAARQQQQAVELQGQVDATEAMLAGLDASNHELDNARSIYSAWLATTKTKIEEINALAQISASNAILDANAKAAADAAQAWKHAANTIENDLTNAILDGGGRGWKKLIRDMEMAFAKLVLQPILEPISGGLATTLSPFLGNSTITAGSATGAIGLAQTASNMYGMVTGGMTLGGGLGTGFMGSLAGGLNGAGIGSGLTSSIGLSIGNSIAGVVGPSVAGALSTGLGAVATALPWIGAAVAAVAIGKAAFGMGPKQTTSQGMSGTLSASGLTGSNYSDWTEKGGWFRSDKHGTDTTSFSAATVSQFTQGLQSLETAASGFASSLGVTADSIKDYSKTFDIQLTGDATKDQQAVATFFAGVSDELANKLIPNLADFSKTGETASATLQRLAGDFASTNQIAQLIGKTGAEMFGSLGMDSAAARERVIDLAGGVSTLSQQAQSYATNYLTDAQKLAPVQKALDAAMASLGLSCVQTREQFKAVVDSLDLTTEAGAKEFASLMGLADAFAQVHAAGRSAADILSERQNLQDQYDQLTMTSAQLLAKQRNALDDSNKALFDQVQALQAQKDAIQAVKDAAGGLLGDVDNAFTVLQNVTKTTTDAIQARITAEQALSDAIKSTLDGMKAPSNDLTDRAAAQAQIKAAIAAVQAGGQLPTADSLKNALSTVSQDASAKFTTYADYLKDLYSTKNDLSQLGDLADSTLSVDQAQLKKLNDMLAAAQKQIDLLKGIDTTGLSIEQALAGFKTAVLAAQANPVNAATAAVGQAYHSALGRAPDAAGLAFWQQQAASGVSIDAITKAITSSPEATIQGMYQTMLHRTADAEGLNFWMTQLKNGVPLSAIGNAIAGSGEQADYAKLHPFAIGTNYIPETMPALVHEGERIIPAADNRELMRRLSSPSDNSGALLAELKASREENARMRQMMESHLYSIAKSTRNTSDALEGAVRGQRPLQTQAATA